MSRILLEQKLIADAEAYLRQNAELIGPGAIAGADVAAGLETADAVIAGAWVAWDAARFKLAGRIKAIARTGIGYDNVDVPAATAAGVCVINTPDAPTESTAEFTITLMLAVARKLPLADRRYRSEGWVKAGELLGVDLAEKTLGLAGLGRIGARVAEIARALRMKVIAYDPMMTPEQIRARGAEPAADLPALLAAADVVSLHLPLVAQTRGLIGAKELALMKRGGILINAARGPIVVESALYDALKSGHLRGAGLDVWEKEPTAPGNPLLTLDNVVAAPHIAAATEEGWRRSHVMAAKCTLMVLNGEKPTFFVNPEVWEKRRK